MPNFTPAPDPKEREHVMPILRTPSKGNLTAIVTATEIVGCNTHWYMGRTVPCELDGCPACADGVGWRWHGYLSATTPQDNAHFLFEFTAAAHAAFALYKLSHANFRGCIFKASRIGKRSNGRVQILTKKSETPLDLLPQPPNIERVLCHIWNVEPNSMKDAAYTSEFNGNKVRHTRQPFKVK